MIPYLILAALVFGACFLVDKGFAKLFRSADQHKSGLAVKHNKRAALFGLFLVVLGVVGVLTGIGGAVGLLILSVVVLLMGIALLVYYLSFGIYYDEEGFLLSTFGRKNVTFRYADIEKQQRYLLQGGAVIVELHMADGKAVAVQSNMEGFHPFLDHAFARWCALKGLDQRGCDFHDPGSFRWFPDTEEE